MESDDVVLEIFSYLDVVSTVQFLSVSIRFWNLRTNSLIINNTVPYKKYIKYEQWNKALIAAVKRNNFPQIVFFIEKGADDFNGGLQEASFAGNIELVKYFMEHGATKWSVALRSATRGAHKNLVDMFLLKFEDTDISRQYGYGYTEAAKSGQLELFHYFRGKKKRPVKLSENPLASAAEGGNREIIDYLIEHGSRSWDAGMLGAAKGGHTEWVEFFWNKQGAETHFVSHAIFLAAWKGNKNIIEFLCDKIEELDWNEAMNRAAGGGHRRLVEYFVQKGSTDWESGLCQAACNGNLELVNFFIEKGAHNFDSAIDFASYEDHRELIEMFLDKTPAKNLNGSLLNASMYGHKRLVELFIEKGATNVTEALVDAGEGPYKNLVRLLLDKGADLKAAIAKAKDNCRLDVEKYLQSFTNE